MLIVVIYSCIPVPDPITIFILPDSVCYFIAWFFRNISKTAQTIWNQKIKQNHGIFLHKIPLMSERRKNYIFRDINYFSIMFVN